MDQASITELFLFLFLLFCSLIGGRKPLFLSQWRHCGMAMPTPLLFFSEASICGNFWIQWVYKFFIPERVIGYYFALLQLFFLPNVQPFKTDIAQKKIENSRQAAKSSGTLNQGKDRDIQIQGLNWSGKRQRGSYYGQQIVTACLVAICTLRWGTAVLTRCCVVANQCWGSGSR